MPFGAVFAALLLGLLGLALPLSAFSAATAPLALARVALGLICLNTSIGLLRRQGWARGSALLVAAVLIVLNDIVIAPAGGVLKLAVIFGALLALLLLALPVTGKFSGAPTASKAPLSALAVATGFGFLALTVSLGWGLVTSRSPQARASEAPIQIAGLAPRISWAEFDAGIERARLESKPLLVTFMTNWCGYCKKLNRTTYKDSTVVARLNEMVAVRINAEDDEKKGTFSGRELAARYGVAGFPSMLLLDAEGRVLSKTSGYLDAARFLDWIDGAVGSQPARTATLGGA